jgi:hypothetical protein
MNATNLLNLKNPELLFSKDDIKNQFRALALKWHPDRCHDPRCSEVFSHINNLYNSGLEKIKKGYWNTFGLLEVQSVEGKKYNIRYKAFIPFQLGVMYVGDTVVVYKVKKEFEKLYKSFIDNISGLRYNSDKMKEEFSRYFPAITATITTADDLYIVLKKTQDVLPLSVVLKYFGGSIDPKSVAWIVSTLHNIHCFLQYNELVHNDITLDTYFISPSNHSGLLLGGWWYTAGVNKKLKGVPNGTFEKMRSKKRLEKVADRMVDGELIRSLARTLLGDEIGMKLVSKLKVPEDMSMWLRFPGSGSAVQDYKKWRNEVLPKSFGERRFTPMNINITDAYDKFMTS